MNKPTTKIVAIVLILTCCALSAMSFALSVKDYADTAIVAYTVAIDAGHGGIDGGVVASDGTKESDLMVGDSSKIHQTKRKMVELFPQSEFPDVEKESCVSYGAALRMVSQYDKNSKVQVKDLLQCSYGMRFPSGVMLMVLKGDEIPCESKPLHAVMKGDDEYIITSIYQYDGNVDKLRDVHHPQVNVINCRKVHNVKIHNPNPQPGEKKKLEFKLLVHEDGQLEMTCLDMNKGEMLESSICSPLQIV